MGWYSRWKTKRLVKRMRKEAADSAIHVVLVNASDIEVTINRELHWLLRRNIEDIWVVEYDTEVVVYMRSSVMASLLGFNGFIRRRVETLLEGRMPIGIGYRVDVV